jgi:hypothetical protein
MRRLAFILTLFFFATMQKAIACDCNSAGPFLDVASKAEFVALVKVVQYLSFKDIHEEKTPMSMKVEIITIYKGEETRKTVTVWGDNGILCRPYLSEFLTGEYYVIAFYKGSDKGAHKNEKKTDYSISVCGDYWLKADVQKQMAYGSGVEKQTQIKLADMKAKL